MLALVLKPLPLLSHICHQTCFFFNCVPVFMCPTLFLERLERVPACAAQTGSVASRQLIQSYPNSATLWVANMLASPHKDVRTRQNSSSPSAKQIARTDMDWGRIPTSPSWEKRILFGFSVTSTADTDCKRQTVEVRASSEGCGPVEPLADSQPLRNTTLRGTVTAKTKPKIGQTCKITHVSD